MSDTAYHSETLAETIHALRDTRHVPIFVMKRQANRLMAGVLAVAMLAASALPSHADKRGDDLAKIIVGALVLGAVVNAIDNNKHHDQAPPQQHKPHKPKPQPGGLPVVPSVCAIEIESSEGEPVRMYGEKCLLERGFDYRLPDCAHDVKVYGQKDRIYSAKCLREAGFKLGH